VPYTEAYIPGDRKVDCDICGFTWRASQMRRGVSGNQKGLIVCPRDFDELHPLENKPTIRREAPPEEIV